MRHLAIDPSQHCGWAHGEPGGEIKFGTFHLKGDRITRKLLNLESFLVGIIKGNGIARCYVEAPLVLGKNSMQSSRSSIGINTIIGVTCTRLGVDCYEVDQQTWRSGFMRDPGSKSGITKAPKMTDEVMRGILIDEKDAEAVAKFEATGGMGKDGRRAEARRRWMKNRTIQECEKRGHLVQDDDAADAVGILLWKFDQMQRVDETPQFDLTGGLSI